jgi:excinuclease ABC subunit C
VDGLFRCGAFTGFGPNRFGPAFDTDLLRISARRPGRLRAKMRELCARQPGVYGMVNNRGELVYVGKAKCLRTRLLSYFRAHGRDPKAGRILQQTRSLVWEYAPSEFAALLRELELIRRWRCRFNVQGQPSRRRPVYVCLGRHPAPYAFLASRPPAAVLACFGPVPVSQHAREAVRRLNDWYRLRDCAQAQEMVFADQGELFPTPRAAGCLRYGIGTCLGPCLAACSRREYMASVRALQDFLGGVDSTPLDQLEYQMTAASTALQYERAAALRDKLEPLRWLRNRLDRLIEARQQAAHVYPVLGSGGKDIWYLIRDGRVAAALPVPATAEERIKAAQTIHATYKQTSRSEGALPPAEAEEMFLVAAWFRRYPAERARLQRPNELL